MLEPSECQAAIAEWHRLASERSPPNNRPVGCMVMILTVVVGIAIPTVLGWIGLQLPQGARSILLAVLCLVFVGGLLVWLFAPSQYGRYLQGAEAAVKALAAGKPDTKNAVALIFYAYSSDGPSLDMTFKPEEVRVKLGAALPYVIEVEQVLLEELKIYRVFTAAPADTSPATPPATPPA
jgi:cbb3-type cytochrome oxidase subunit 3